MRTDLEFVEVGAKWMLVTLKWSDNYVIVIRNYDENALLESSGIALLFNLILSVYTLDFILP